jgi:hypothetical protein
VVEVSGQAGEEVDALEASSGGAPAPDRLHLSQRRVDALWGLGASVVALLVAVVNLRLWEAPLHVPMAPGGDITFAMAVVKGMIEHGWIFTNPDIGAPFGTQFYDYPVGFGELLHQSIMRIFGFVSNDPIAVINVFYVVGYPLVAAAAFGVLRALGISRGVALVCAVLYAVIPYHFLRGEVHLTLSAYYGVPLGCWLILAGMGHADLFRRKPTRHPALSRWLTRRSLLTALLCLVVGTATLYYALFTVMLLVLCGFVAFTVNRDVRQITQSVIAAGLILLVVVVSESPVLVYQHEHGKNPIVAVRSPAESEVYGLKLAYMIFPRPGHRLTPLANLGAKYTSNPLPSEGFSASLGIAMTIGLCLAIVTLLGRGLRIGRQESSGGGGLMASAGLGALVAFLLGTVGGGSALLAYGISSQIRGWDRISVFISFFALVGLALALMRMGEVFGHRRSWMFGPALVVVLVLGVLDQTTSKDAPDYSAIAAAWRIDSRFGQAIEREAPTGTRVLQLPYVPFPENPPVQRMGDYDLFRGYIHTTGLDWSYGAMKGRPQDWLASADSDVRSLLPAAVGAGFRGLYIDQFGYADGGAAITQAIVSTLGYNDAILSADGRLAYFDLRRYARALAQRVPRRLEQAAGAALTHPPVPTFGDGFYGPESDGTSKWHWMKSQGELQIANTTGVRQAVSVKAVLNPAKDASRVAIRWPGGPRQILRIRKPTQIARTLRLPTGASEITIAAVGPRGALTPTDKRDRRLQVVNLQITDLSIPRLESDAKR